MSIDERSISCSSRAQHGHQNRPRTLLASRGVVNEAGNNRRANQGEGARICGGEIICQSFSMMLTAGNFDIEKRSPGEKSSPGMTDGNDWRRKMLARRSEALNIGERGGCMTTNKMGGGALSRHLWQKLRRSLVSTTLLDNLRECDLDNRARHVH